MNKKILVPIIILPIILLTLFYSRPIKVGNLIKPLSSSNLPMKIESTIFFSVAPGKELDVSNKKSIEELTSLVENIKVRKNIIAPQSYKPLLKETYKLTLYGKDNTYCYINILDSKYIQVNNTIYRMLGDPNLSKVYDIIILDQAEGSLDEFYYDLIDNS